MQQSLIFHQQIRNKLARLDQSIHYFDSLFACKRSTLHSALAHSLPQAKNKLEHSSPNFQTNAFTAHIQVQKPLPQSFSRRLQPTSSQYSGKYLCERCQCQLNYKKDQKQAGPKYRKLISQIQRLLDFTIQNFQNKKNGSSEMKKARPEPIQKRVQIAKKVVDLVIHPVQFPINCRNLNQFQSNINEKQSFQFTGRPPFLNISTSSINNTQLQAYQNKLIFNLIETDRKTDSKPDLQQPSKKTDFIQKFNKCQQNKVQILMTNDADQRSIQHNLDALGTIVQIQTNQESPIRKALLDQNKDSKDDLNKSSISLNQSRLSKTNIKQRLKGIRQQKRKSSLLQQNKTNTILEIPQKSQIKLQTSRRRTVLFRDSLKKITSNLSIQEKKQLSANPLIKSLTLNLAQQIRNPVSQLLSLCLREETSLSKESLKRFTKYFTILVENQQIRKQLQQNLESQVAISSGSQAFKAEIQKSLKVSWFFNFINRFDQTRTLNELQLQKWLENQLRAISSLQPQTIQAFRKIQSYLQNEKNQKKERQLRINSGALKPIKRIKQIQQFKIACPQLRQYLQENKQKISVLDQNFPASPKSIGFKNQKFCWKKAFLCKSSLLYSDSPNQVSIKGQQQSPVLNLLKLISKNPNFLKLLIKRDCQDVITIMFSKSQVQVDDFVPFLNDAPAFAQYAVNQQQLLAWPLLIQKAMAKLLGSYKLLYDNKKSVQQLLRVVLGCEQMSYNQLVSQHEQNEIWMLDKNCDRSARIQKIQKEKIKLQLKQAQSTCFIQMQRQQFENEKERWLAFKSRRPIQLTGNSTQAIVQIQLARSAKIFINTQTLNQHSHLTAFLFRKDSLQVFQEIYANNQFKIQEYLQKGLYRLLILSSQQFKWHIEAANCRLFASQQHFASALLKLMKSSLQKFPFERISQKASSRKLKSESSGIYVQQVRNQGREGSNLSQFYREILDNDLKLVLPLATKQVQSKETQLIVVKGEKTSIQQYRNKIQSIRKIAARLEEKRILQ